VSEKQKLLLDKSECVLPAQPDLYADDSVSKAPLRAPKPSHTQCETQRIGIGGKSGGKGRVNGVNQIQAQYKRF
jgi:hypothetical protein